MTLIEHTAYPRLKRTLTPKELDQIYTPTLAEIFLAHCTAKGQVAMLGFLVHLKVFQRLGYAVATSEVPTSIVDYIATCANVQLSSRELTGYDDSGTRRRHLPLIRAALSIQPYGPLAHKAFLRAMIEAARTKDDLADLINVALVLTLRDLVTVYGKEGTSEERLAAMESVIGDRAAKILQDCEEHLAYVGNNYQPFLWSYYKGHRAQLFRLLSAMEFRSSSQDRSLEEAIVFLKDHEGSRGEWLITATVQKPDTPEEQRLPLVDLSWASDTWWKFMTGQSKRVSCPDKVLRRHFEIAVFSQLLWDLKSGDLYGEYSRA